MQPGSFPFGKEVQSYRQAEIVTPFQQQNQLFDKPVGQFVYKAHMWRVIFFSGVGLSFILSLVLIAYLNAIPYKILVNQITNNGFLQASPELLSTDYSVSQATLAGFMKRMLLSEKLGGSYASFVDEDALGSLKRNLVLIPASDIKEGHFSEFKISRRSFYGKFVDKDDVAILIISGQFSQEPLETEEEVKINPLGIYIQSLAIQRL